MAIRKRAPLSGSSCLTPVVATHSENRPAEVLYVVDALVYISWIILMNSSPALHILRASNYPLREGSEIVRTIDGGNKQVFLLDFEFSHNITKYIIVFEDPVVRKESLLVE